MWLYEEAYGFTQLRVYTHSFMVWLAVVLLLFLAGLLRGRPNVFVFGSFVAALVYLALLNLANPDALIVRANIARYYESGKLDAGYLASLSADATPDLVDSLDHVDAAARAIFFDAFRQQRLVLSEARTQQGWPAWSIARSRALTALESIPLSTTDRRPPTADHRPITHHTLPRPTRDRLVITRSPVYPFTRLANTGPTDD